MASTIGAWAQQLSELPLSLAIGESLYLFPALNLLHVLAIVLLAGSIAIVDLRLLGVALREIPITRLSRQLLPLTWIGAIVMAVTGVLLLAPQASRIYVNSALLAKLGLLVLAGFNAAVWHALLSRNLAAWDARSTPPWQARLAGASSLLLWASIIVAGRLIAFII